MDVFTLDGMRDMVESQCFRFWNSWLRKHNRFVQRVMGSVSLRHFDITLLNKLAALGSRNSDNVVNLFWTATGSETTQSPFPGRGRSRDILTLVSDRHFRRVYDKLVETQNLSFPLLSKHQFSQFKQHNVAALRSVMDQVLRWLVPQGDFVPGAGRYAAKRDLSTVLQHDKDAEPRLSILKSSRQHSTGGDAFDMNQAFAQFAIREMAT